LLTFTGVDNQEQEKTFKKKSLTKRITRFFMFIFLFFTVSFAVLLALLFIYEDDVKSAILKELNKHLRAEVKIDPKNIDLTIIKTFPDCSLQFKDALMLEAITTKKRDTLMYAGQINLLFNIMDLWNKNYSIEKIKVKDAFLKLRVKKDGTENYIFWKESDGQGKSTNFNLKLISLDNVTVNYKNTKELFKTEFQIKNLSFSGNFSDEKYDLKTKGTALIDEITQGKTTFLRNKDLRVDLALAVDGNAYKLQNCNIILNELALQFEGDFNYGERLNKMKLRFNAPDLQIAALLSLLPQNYRESVSDYESKGLLYAKGTIEYNGTNSLVFLSDFGLESATITYKPGATSAENVQLIGKVKYSANSTFLDLKNIHLNLNGEKITGDCSVRDFNNPFVKISADASVNLEDLINFWPIDTLTMLKGQLNLSTTCEGLVSDLKGQAFGQKVKLDLLATVKLLEAQFKGDDKSYAIENCELQAHDGRIDVKDLKLKRGKSDLILNGTIPGMFNYLLDNTAPLIISGSLEAQNIRMEDFIAEAVQNNTVNEKALIPANMRFNLDAKIAKFSFGKFEATAITGDIEIKDQKAIVNEIRLRSMGGEAAINAFIDNSKKNKLDLVLESNLDNIDISELFRQMNNFGQTTLKENNIKGVGTATIDFSGAWNNNLDVNEKSIVSNCNLIIDRGELNDFEPLLILSRFVAIDELKRIKFSSLQSNIQIANSTITLPRTVLKNSALNLELWGTHTFNNDIDYHIQMLLSELLHSKRKKKDSEFGPIENDSEKQRMAYVLMTGNLDNPIVKFDKQGLKAKIKSDFKQERKTVRNILREEVGLFKKDSVIKKPAEQPVFELEPENPTPKKKPLELKKKPDDEDF